VVERNQKRAEKDKDKEKQISVPRKEPTNL
jgi:hypothetical protein